MKGLIQYLANNYDFSVQELRMAADKMYYARVQLNVASYDLEDRIYDAVMDYAEEYSLGDDWCDNIETDDVALELLDYLLSK